MIMKGEKIYKITAEISMPGFFGRTSYRLVEIEKSKKPLDEMYLYVQEEFNNKKESGRLLEYLDIKEL